MLARRLIFLLAVLVTVASILPRHVSADNGVVLLSGFPLLKQQHSLTCESSAASMGTRGLITETQIMAAMPRDPNPNLGFRGNLNGQQGSSLVDYGVYAAPVQKALTRYGYGSDLLSYASDETLLSYLDRGWPVVVWITYGLQRAEPRLAWANGSQFFLVPHEHAVLAVGHQPGALIVQDPWDGKRAAYTWPNFNRSWGYFGNMALAIQPCPLPGQVTNLRVASLSSQTLTWKWTGAVNATQYRIEVDMVSPTAKTVFAGVLQSTSYSLKKPKPDASYQITVAAMDDCGVSSNSVTMWARLPSTLSTPTIVPTGSPTVVPSPESTAVPGSPVPTATATPVLAVSPTPTP